MMTYDLDDATSERVKAVFSHETTRSLDFGIKFCNLVRNGAHVFRLPLSPAE
jgi:hypothetical protein